MLGIMHSYILTSVDLGAKELAVPGLRLMGRSLFYDGTLLCGGATLSVSDSVASACASAVL
jgi:hypothetical protein